MEIKSTPNETGYHSKCWEIGAEIISFSSDIKTAIKQYFEKYKHKQMKPLILNGKYCLNMSIHTIVLPK